MARKTNREIAEDIAQHGGIPPSGYTFDPRHDPPLYKTGGAEDDRADGTVDQSIQSVDVRDEGERDGAAEE